MYGSCEHKVAGHETSSCRDESHCYISHALSSIFMKQNLKFWQVLGWLTDLKISAVLLKYPNFEIFLSYFRRQKTNTKLEIADLVT